MTEARRSRRRENKRLLSEEGNKELGHIFTDGYVPTTQYTPVYANLRGLGSTRVYLVDWNRLTEQQQHQCILYISEKNAGANPAQIRLDIEQQGHFPIRTQWIVESYDMCYFQ